MIEVVARGNNRDAAASVLHSGSSAPVGEVLSGLLSSVLTPLDETYSDEQLQVAAAILHETTEIVCREIYLVPDTPSAGNWSQRRPRRPQ